MTARAQSIPTEIAALKAQVAALQAQVHVLQNQLKAAQPVLALAPLVSVNPNFDNFVRGPHIVFHGANIHIVSGSGATDDYTLSAGGTPTGLGNLIIGYTEYPDVLFPAGHRSGSHNLIMGRYNDFRSFGGFVAGEFNAIRGIEASVLVGFGNNAAGGFSVVLGGSGNATDNTHLILPQPPFP